MIQIFSPHLEAGTIPESSTVDLHNYVIKNCCFQASRGLFSRTTTATSDGYLYCIDACFLTTPFSGLLALFFYSSPFDDVMCVCVCVRNAPTAPRAHLPSYAPCLAMKYDGGVYVS